MANQNSLWLEQNSDIARRVEQLKQLALQPGSEVYLEPNQIDLEAWNHVGDPLCENLFLLMRENKLLAGDIYLNARQLQLEGVPEAVAFFADVEAIPSWLDFEAMKAGANMGRRNPIGMMFGMHGGLPFTYIDPATAMVMGSTGRLQGLTYRRRFWETATGFVGALDVEGMKPGGKRWEQWVRIRFMHTMIRMGILRTNQWNLPTAIPISQVATAATVQIFGPYRVNIIRYFGGIASKEEQNSFSLMWRWIARLEGANNQLLGRTHEEQFKLQTLMHHFLYGKTDKAYEMTLGLIDGVASMKEFLLPKRIHAAIVRHLLNPEMMETVDGHNFANDLGLPQDHPASVALQGLTKILKLGNLITQLPIVKSLAEKYGQQFLDFVVAKGLDGIKAEYRGTTIGGTATDK